MMNFWRKFFLLALIILCYSYGPDKAFSSSQEDVDEIYTPKYPSVLILYRKYIYLKTLPTLEQHYKKYNKILATEFYKELILPPHPTCQAIIEEAMSEDFYAKASFLKDRLKSSYKNITVSTLIGLFAFSKKEYLFYYQHMRIPDKELDFLEKCLEGLLPITFLKLYDMCNPVNSSTKKAKL